MCKCEEKKSVSVMEIVAQNLISYAVLFWVISVVVLIASSLMPKNDSDPADGSSELFVYRDELTGCEYVSAGIWPSPATPRLKADGSQVCRD